MPDLYDVLLAALRAHWQAHDNVYPQCFELTALDLQQFNAQRQLVNETMNFRQAEGWQREFHGVPLRQADSNNTVSVSGERTPLVTVTAA